MKIFKFGGASIKDSKSIKNLLSVLEKTDKTNVVLVVSAMGKMTNAFEKIVNVYFDDETKVTKNISFVKTFHNTIMIELFIDKSHPIFNTINSIWNDLELFLKDNKSTNYNFVYDQVVSLAEQVSTKIISAFLSDNGVENQWIDARNYIKTDDNYRDASVDWVLTKKHVEELKNKTELLVTQGFIGSGVSENTTTLGREGSDYTAAIFAYCLDAENVTVFKDVDGVLNADPQIYENAILLSKISYREAIEMAFFGASVIHPKTLQPLQKKEIPLHVKSFVNPLKKGTVIGKGIDLKPKTPCYIVKDKQILISISTRDFSFMMENNISEIFDLLHCYKLRVNLIQNTAISFSVCLEDKFNNFDNFLSSIKEKYKCLFNKNITLLTIRQFDNKAIALIEKEKEILLQQTSRETVQFVVKTIKK